MHKATLRKIMDKNGMPPDKQKVIEKCWNVALLWGASQGAYYSQKDIARMLGVSRNTVRNYLDLFKKEFPEAYTTLEEDRKACRNTVRRQHDSFRRPLSWEALKEEHGDEIENHIVEKF